MEDNDFNTCPHATNSRAVNKMSFGKRGPILNCFSGAVSLESPLLLLQSCKNNKHKCIKPLFTDYGVKTRPT